ncbi:MAG: exosortase F system-associated protein [Flavobacteriaceae bacterium]|jgi:exosortase F-associated protein|nr:exosortase F system-associated protein [Flavobacteriaceae bacterium]
MNKWIRYIFTAVLIFGLILVRKYEDILFYDPFLAFFKGDFLNKEFPEYDLARISIHIIFRYLLNSILTLGIIGLLFWSWKYVKFTALVLLGFLLILLPLYLFMIESEFSIGENLGFYIRRFLIQPMVLLILIPAFYYQKFLKNQNSKEN